MSGSISYRPQIDALRALAVAGVLFHHYWSTSPAGFLGVRLFFVISGFLITGILLDSKRVLPRAGMAATLKSFYFRRVLRIFPAYYLTLLLVLAASVAFPVPDLREGMPWHMAYLSNFFIAELGHWPRLMGHLWTLSVEEQFYLAWPLLVLLVPDRRLAAAFWLVFAIGLAFRLFYFHLAPPGPAMWIATPASFGPLAAGSLLSLAVRGGGLLVPASRIALYLPFAILGAWLFMQRADEYANYVLGGALWLVPMILLVAGAYKGFGGWLGAALENRALVYLGRISYGIYLYHLLALGAFGAAIRLLSLPISPDRGPLTFLIVSPIAVGLAACSWHFFERPILRLRDRVASKAPDAAVSRERLGLEKN